MIEEIKKIIDHLYGEDYDFELNYCCPQLELFIEGGIQVSNTADETIVVTSRGISGVIYETDDASEIIKNIDNFLVLKGRVLK